jgi:hypothetical protein
MGEDQDCEQRLWPTGELRVTLNFSGVPLERPQMAQIFTDECRAQHHKSNKNRLLIHQAFY